MCKTQKAKGLVALRGCHFPTGSWQTAHSREEAAALVTEGIKYTEKDKDGKEVEKVVAPVKDAFARPAPPLPIPGFVPSRSVKTKEDAEKAWDEAQKGAEGAELIIHQRIEGKLSACWTPGLLAIGPGTDGATSGRKSIAVPVCATPTSNENFLKAIARSGIEEHPDPLQRFPHVELIYGSSMYWVQLRAGAQAAGTGDYIPVSGVITEVVKAPDDDKLLMEWGETCRKLAKKEGLQVAWKKGGTQACHAALHAKGAGIPIFFGEKPPKVGDKVEATVASAQAPAADVLKGIAEAWEMKLTSELAKRAVPAAFCMLHGYKPDGGRFLGLAAGVLVRAATAACLGELRHAKGAGYGSGLSRDQVYQKSWADGGNVEARGKLMVAMDAFLNQPWSPAYGGKKWANCAAAAARLDSAIIKLANDKDAASVGEVVMCANDLITQLHNGGKLFNKFMDQGLMDRLSVGDLNSTLQLGPQIWDVHMAAKAVTRQKVTATIAWWKGQSPLAPKTWAPPESKPGSMAFAQYRITGANTIRIQVQLAEGHHGEEGIAVKPTHFPALKAGEFPMPSLAGTDAKYQIIEGSENQPLPATITWKRAGLILTVAKNGHVSAEYMEA